MKSATPGVGKVDIDKKVILKDSVEELKCADWILKTFGGEIRVIETNPKNKTPDYIWNDKMWELKNISSNTSLETRIRKALKQIESNQGGIIFDINDNGYALSNKSLDIISKRMRNNSECILIFKKGDSVLDIYKN